jgi:AraC-like DNA-binding protein
MDLKQLFEDLDAEAYDYREFAARAGYSVAQSYRRAAKAGVAQPLGSRRRVLLERAAWHLTRDQITISELALDAGFESTEGFSRAFARGFGVTPSVFRKLAPREYRIGPRSGIHYAPGNYQVCRQEETMNFIQRLLDTHRDQVLTILNALEARPEIFDTSLPLTNPFPWPWEPDDETVGQLVARYCSGAIPWLHSIEGYTDDPSLGHRQRLLNQHESFSKFVAETERDGTWDVTFVDADCDPPQVFSYSSVIHHVISFNEHARITLIQRLRALGIEGLDPLPAQI